MISKELKHQTQPTPMSCVCTCLAMLMDCPAQEVIDKYHRDYFELQVTEVHHILSHEGFIYKQGMAGQVLPLLPGALYLLTVASLNIPGGLHQVLVDYRDEALPVVLDPAKGYKGRKYYTFDTIEADSVEQAFVLSSWIIDYTITDRG
jgi:hypothetical protein